MTDTLCSPYLRRPLRSLAEVLAERRDYQPDIVYQGDSLRRARDEAASAVLMATRLIREALPIVRYRGWIFEMQKSRRHAFLAKRANEALIAERDMARRTMEGLTG